MESLSAMFDPRSVALIGATEKEGTAGRAILENLLRSGRQKIFAVNPNTQTVLDLDCHPTVSALPQKPDLVVIAVRAELVPAIVVECGEAGIQSAVVVSTGFGELGEAGKQLEERLRAGAKLFNVRVLGPGSLGIVRPSVGLNASLVRVDPARGNIAFISQSGQLGDAVLEWALEAHVGFSLFVSLGSMSDIDFGDLIDFVGDDYETRSILLDMEQINDARKFMSAARGFARTKPIIVLKPGRLEIPRERTDPPLEMGDLVYDAAFRRVGLLRVKEAADLFNAAQVLDAARLPQGPRLAIVSNSSTAGRMAKDALLEQGGELAQPSDKCMQELDEALPRWTRENPIALPVDADLQHYGTAIRCCLKDPSIDALLVIHLPRALVTPVELANAMVAMTKGMSKPVLAAMMGGQSSREGVRLLIANNIPTYGTPEEAVNTYLQMYRYKRNLELLYETPEELPLEQAPSRYRLRTLMHRQTEQGRKMLTVEQSFDLLADYGVPVVPAYTVVTEEEALNRARELGYPVVLKLMAGMPASKGGMRTSLGVASEEGLRSAFDALSKSIEENKDRDPQIPSITIQKMQWGVGYQLIVLAERHEQFGMVMLFGTGGMGYDLFHDYSIALPPLNQTLARRLIEETKAYDILQGYRGRRPADIKQLERILVSISNLIVDFPEIASIEIDPMVIAEGKILVLAAGITVADVPASGTSMYPHLVITPYPTRYTTQWRLKSGTEVTLRPIRPEDEPLEHDMLTTLSELTLKQRFFSPIKSWTHDTLVRFCNIDYEREVAIVVLLPGEKRIIGIGRLIIQPGFKKGEFAVLVHDEFQGEGLGYKLVSMLIGIGQEKGLEEIEAIVLSDNDRMATLCKNLGFKRKLLPEGISRIFLRLE
jgi:acetyltransferase